ncbi:hypothetical protein [Actinoplanes sp. OR16]|nr:hypothetical protein [Actinoplanes sp. OR16]
MFTFIVVLLAAVALLGGYLAFRRRTNPGDVSPDSYKAGWINKSEGI